MAEDAFIISFPQASAAKANQYASDLAMTLRNLSESIAVEQKRESEDTQDFGATLAIVLGTSAATAVAQGIATWLTRHSGARIQISAKGNVIATNLDSRDAARIAEAFSHRR